jgi:hypothetical protein
MMEERMMTNEEEAVMNMELFKTEELFRSRLKMTLLDLLSKDADIRYMMRAIAEERLMSFRDSLANAVRNTY